MEKENKFKVIEGGKCHGKAGCDCPFCRCKCPKCGADEIEMVFKPKWSMEKYMKDNITLFRQENYIRLECLECGAILEYSDDDFFQSNADLSDLLRTVDSLLGLPYSVFAKYIEDGKIEIKRGYPSE